MDDYLLSLLSFTGAAVIFTMTPGLDTVMTLRVSASEGRLAGMGAMSGICCGLSIWGIAAAFGLTALLSASTLAFDMVKIAGAAYLAYLGIGLILKPRSSLGGNNLEEAHQILKKSSVFYGAFRKGIMTNLLNPKVGIFTITLFPQFIPSHGNPIAFSLVLTLIQTILDIFWLGSLVLLTAPLGRFLRTPKVVRCLDRMSGIIFIGFGLLILFEKNSPS